MIYPSANSWREAPSKRVVLFGMSGLGKTHVSNILRASGDWFHYSVDYRIGTKYMGEHISDSFKREAMTVPYLRDLLLSDSIYIGSNITFDNLAPLSHYLGKPGNPAEGGLQIDEYIRRQDLHLQAEVAAMNDTAHFVDRAKDIYGYDHFVCDTSGSICEVVDPADPNDPVLNSLSKTALLVWIKGSDAHADELARRFDRAPKPMYYQRDFLSERWAEYLDDKDLSPNEVDPDDFVRWAYRKALSNRQPRYEAMSNWGVTVTADEISNVKSTNDFDNLIAQALERQ
ncbi:MAG: ATPase [Paracoccaceae bacterium]|nr:ATPase [Paracoccaceae bacterium]